MLKTMNRSPLKHVEKNLAFSTDGKVSAVYEVDGFEYDHQDESTKKDIIAINSLFLPIKNMISTYL